MSLLCVVCITLDRADTAAITVVQGNSVCLEHVNVIGLSRAASTRIRFMEENAEQIRDGATNHRKMQRALSRDAHE